MSELEQFLNETTLSGLEKELPGDKEYYKVILSHIRKLLVHCEEGLDACKVIMNSEPFSKGAAEKFFIGFIINVLKNFSHLKTTSGMRTADLLIRVKILLKCGVRFLTA